MSSFEEAERFVEFHLFTRPGDFGGEECRDTSITHILEQGVIEPRAIREVELRARAVPGALPGLAFVSIVTGRRTIGLNFTFDGRPINMEAAFA